MKYPWSKLNLAPDSKMEWVISCDSTPDLERARSAVGMFAKRRGFHKKTVTLPGGLSMIAGVSNEDFPKWSDRMMGIEVEPCKVHETVCGPCQMGFTTAHETWETVPSGRELGGEKGADGYDVREGVDVVIGGKTVRPVEELVQLLADYDTPTFAWMGEGGMREQVEMELEMRQAYDTRVSSEGSEGSDVAETR